MSSGMDSRNFTGERVMPTRKPTELLRRAREQAEAYVTGVRKDGWLTNENTVGHLAAFGEQFAEQIVREAAEIASLDADQFEAEFPDLWIQYFDNEITLAQMDRRAILRKFGLEP